MAMPLPAGPVLERFRRDLAALVPGQAPLAVAVSGGADSLAMLLLVAAARPGAARAATVDHGLRPESAAEARCVAEVCHDLGVPHDVLRASVRAGGAGVQGEARAARYEALGAWMQRENIPFLLTGHHADDQAETLLMRLQRGSGVGGLAGVRAGGPLPGSNGTLAVCRPLLGWRRSELVRILEAAGLRPVDDPSNADPLYDRVRLRQQMRETPWLEIAAIARSAAALAEADDALDEFTSRLFAERVSLARTVALEPAGVPAEILRRLVTRCLQAVVPGAAPRGEQVTALLTSLRTGLTVTLAGVKCSGGAAWTFEPAPPRRR